LFADAGLGQRDETAVMIGEIGLASVMDFGKPSDRSLELFLLGEQLVDEIAGIRKCFAFECWDALEGGWHLGGLRIS
jgi:hypothetical protein